MAQQGLLIWCLVGSERVYYQIVDGLTHEDSYESDRQGRQIAVAAQLGVPKENKGFERYPWLPQMNTPIFFESMSEGEPYPMGPGDFVYGNIPGSDIQIGGAFAENMCYHTAILGVTGAGKTELALDMLRDAVAHGIKVICIDLTALYEGRLTDLKPVDLSVSKDDADELAKKLFEVETGEYRASAEKRALEQFMDDQRSQIRENLLSFLNSENQVAVITVHEISNTEATLLITEAYLSCLLTEARNGSDDFPRTLVVVEEAHTVMPEPSMAGVGSYESRALVTRISQIALQGRKYGIGLLVIAQRTATVSKSVLTQCNTVISFSCFDSTSMEFLSNFYGSEHSSLLPSLAPLQVIAYGKCVRSQRPILLQIPYDDSKAQL